MFLFTNKLSQETSPYLLQHAHNPVNWYPWGDEALNKAKVENKLMVISVGYSACHWCHVMEHESFSNHEVAKIMNENFVSIKVDREERPDIDQVYMEAVQLLIGQGGWPLNVIALPNGKPIWGGTYFPKKQWIEVLNHLQALYFHNPNKLSDQAEALTKGIAQNYFFEPCTSCEKFSKENIDNFLKDIVKNIDDKWGGTLGAPKFPMPSIWSFLLENKVINKSSKFDYLFENTLQKMWQGGIYDHIGGGFARYSVDGHWHVPHFEKMLYDNAQLLSLYSNAYSVFKNEDYKEVLDAVANFLLNEFKSNAGGYYSAYDADSEGEEGKYYVWSAEEFNGIVKDELVAEYFDVRPSGNWEKGVNVLRTPVPFKEFIEKHSVSQVEFENRLLNAKKILKAHRDRRRKPLLDTKILTSWNALAIKGFVDAYKATGNELYLDEAISIATFIIEKCTDKGVIYRSFSNGTAKINGFLDDYAFLIEAFIGLYSITFEKSWIIHVEKFLKYTLNHFFNCETAFFYYTSNNQEELIARKPELLDNVIPSSNSAMCKNLLLIGSLLEKESYHTIATQMLHNVSSGLEKASTYMSNWASAYLLALKGINEIVIQGVNKDTLKNELIHNFLPNSVIMDTQLVDRSYVKVNGTENKIIVCRNNTCFPPINTVNEVLKVIYE